MKEAAEQDVNILIFPEYTSENWCNLLFFEYATFDSFGVLIMHNSLDLNMNPLNNY